MVPPVLAARDRGAAVLLISEDLDEILFLADEIRVIADGRLSLGAPGAASAPASAPTAAAKSKPTASRQKRKPAADKPEQGSLF